MVDWDCPVKNCKGEVRDTLPGVDWNMEDDEIAKYDLECDTCGKEFTVYYGFRRLECANCGGVGKDCECD